MNPLSPSSLSKRALSGSSQARGSPSRSRPYKKPKENRGQEKHCSVCLEPVKEQEGAAHKACTVASVFVLFDGGKIRVQLKRNKDTRKFSCPRCSNQYHSSVEIQRHAKCHANASLQSNSRNIPTISSTSQPPRANAPSPATETASILSSPRASLEPITAPSRTQRPTPDTLQTILLNRYGLVVNTTHKVLICLGCQAAIDPTAVRQHFFKNHKSHTTPLDLQAQLDTEASTLYPDITSSPFHPTEPVDLIYGLEDPVADYLQCNICKHCFASTKSFDKHPCSSREATWIKTSAQRFVKNFTSPWFAVKPTETAGTEESHRWASYQSQQALTAPVAYTPSQSDDFRVLHQFLRNERWIQRVDGLSHEELMHIVSYSTQDTAYGGLHYHVNAFLTSAQSSLDEPYIRRAIGTRPAEEQDTSRIKFHRDVNKATLDHYSRTIAAMISFIHRIILDVDTTYTFPIPGDVTTACNDLFQHFSPPSAHEEARLEEDTQEGDDVEESSGSSEDEEGQSSRQPHLRLQLTTSTTSTTPLIQTKIFTLLFLLFTQLPTNDFRGQFFTPIYHFLLLSSLRKNRAWAAANTITHTIAVVLFTGRLVFSSETIRYAGEHNVDYSSAFATVEKYFEESSGAIMPRLYITKRGFTGLHSAEETTFFFNAPDLSGTSAIIDDTMLHLSQIKASHLRAMAEIENELNSLTFHASYFTLPDDTFVHDSPRDRSPGYSFLKHTKNIWNHRPSLIQHIIESDTLFAKFAYITPTGSVSWIPSAISEHMKSIHDLQMKFLCAIILSYGEPARGTELASHLLANVSGGSIRNFFVIFDIPVLRASFSKTTSMSGDKVIYRIPLPRLARQFVRFLAYLRPAFIEWQKFLNPFMISNAEYYLFPGLYRPLNAHDVSKVLASYTHRELGLRMKIRRYRQYMAFITSCNQEVFDVASSYSGATHDQFGHTAKINVQHYGRDFRTPEGTNFSSFISAARVSGVFHILYGHPPDLLQRLEYGQGHIALMGGLGG
ncbi:hypothetical protein AGABI1DRAFT_125786 [Agaricus bisporus var. burnettii JB137-S8]|uniref:C2H2-type domain-containing protein n=1 Tax=Agaricus bisporus var. burnettii (strain JB137-S8 / ATCC MYA-4627 / FGSC 10392) TaxID=597362 RepID=K5X0R1_AGABU|nr:uncharacterized protein AGABI1DRAFT_125786 [Agaricus bisporus var. burnettii JB137-S8]EKM81396.1 hypothetical protein AGABI1DRAFT_125786 [Agaricus bisporus var. burnettii JB137-S8]